MKLLEVGARKTAPTCWHAMALAKKIKKVAVVAAFATAHRQQLLMPRQVEATIACSKARRLIKSIASMRFAMPMGRSRWPTSRVDRLAPRRQPD